MENIIAITTDTIDHQHICCAISTYSFFYDGAFVANEIFGPSKFERFLDEHGFKP